ncbi:ROK family protein [Tropheryma whipplei]|uniref:ROK family protein n=1 Tax=Tropheryma whipplei TaxID=2039 RepID=UPI0004B0A177|nr:ROK family protein [Tropheryma whipplei]
MYFVFLRAVLVRAIGVDIGGTKISAALVDRSGNMDGQLTVPTDPVGVIDQVVELVNKLSDGESVCAVGVAVASFLNYSRDFVYNSPNLGLENIPIRNLLQNRIKFPVFIENDANAAAWAEWRFAPRSVEIVNSQDLFMITVGTGVGGAAILDGKILKGGFGIASEPGHIVLVPDGIPCGCGKRGCSEQYASGTALLRYVKSNMPDFPFGRNPSDVIGELVAKSDPVVLSAVSQVADNVGRTAAAVTAILDPELFVIGGGVSKIGTFFIDSIRESYKEYLPHSESRPCANFRLAHFYNTAGIIGVADLARSSLAT